MLSDIEIIESDTEKARRKHRQETKLSVKTISQEYVQRMNKCVDRTIVERKQPRPAEAMTLTEAGLLSQKEMEELGQFA